MIFNVAQLLKEPVGATRAREVAEEVGAIDASVRTATPVTGRAKLTRTKDGILVDAQLHTLVRLDCSRCLTEITVPLDLRFREEFQPVIDIASGLPLPEPGDRSVFPIDEHHTLDLGEAFRQYALLALPMAPLCNAACAGLCPVCGKNLNDGPCQCSPAEVDSHLQALEQLLSKTDANLAEETAPARRKRRKR